MFGAEGAQKQRVQGLEEYVFPEYPDLNSQFVNWKYSN